MAEEIPGPIGLLAKQYEKDLAKLDEFDRLVGRADFATYADLNEMEVMARKYGLKDKITKENAKIILGKNKSIVMERWQNLKDDIMEKHREKSLDRVPTKDIITTDKIPRTLTEVEETPKEEPKKLPITIKPKEETDEIPKSLSEEE